MDYVVVSLGGSVLVPDDHDLEYLSALASMLRKATKKNRLVLVCGGGKVARYYINLAREMRANRDVQDELGINITRLNARILRIALGADADDVMPRTVPEAVEEAHKGKIVVMGGTVPGHTTDAVSAMVASELKAARIVNATSVDAAYSADPKKYDDAERFTEITHQRLFDLVNKGLHAAGPSDVFDRLGAQVAMQSNIPVYVVHGRDLEDLEKAIAGEKVKGTVVRN